MPMPTASKCMCFFVFRRLRQAVVFTARNRHFCLKFRFYQRKRRGCSVRSRPFGTQCAKKLIFCSAVSACARNQTFLHQFYDSGVQFRKNRCVLHVSRPCVVKNPCVFDDSCHYFDNVMRFYAVPKVRFLKMSCFTCLERLGV